MWRAPEFADEFVLSSVVKDSVRVYRRLPLPDGSLQWTPIHVVQPPPGYKIHSPERVPPVSELESPFV